MVMMMCVCVMCNGVMCTLSSSDGTQLKVQAGMNR